MKRAALLVLTLALVLPATFFFGESPAAALTCPEQCRAENVQCLSPCLGSPSCRAYCNDAYAACLASCP
jgi:hypothetical protein